MLKGIKTNKYCCLFLLTYVSFMIYPSHAFISFVDTKTKLILRAIAFLIVLILYLKELIQFKRISKLFILTSIISFYLAVITIVKHGAIDIALYSNMIILFSIFMSTELFYVESYRKEYVYINYILLYFNLIILFVLNIIIHYGYYDNMFNRNNFILYYFPLLVFEYIIKMDYDNKIWKVLRCISFIIILIISIRVGGTTSIICLSLVYLFIYLLKDKLINFKILSNWKTYYLFLLIVFVVFIYNIDKIQVANIISSLLNKTNGFSGRDQVYIGAKENILKNFFFGIGTQIEYYQIYNGLINAHNFVFQYWIDGGTIGLILLLIPLTYTFVCANRLTNVADRYVYLMFLTIFIFRNMFEAIGLNYLFYTICIIHYMRFHNDEYIYLKKAK